MPETQAEKERLLAYLQEEIKRYKAMQKTRAVQAQVENRIANLLLGEEPPKIVQPATNPMLRELQTRVATHFGVQMGIEEADLLFVKAGQDLQSALNLFASQRRIEVQFEYLHDRFVGLFPATGKGSLLLEFAAQRLRLLPTERLVLKLLDSPTSASASAAALTLDPASLNSKSLVELGIRDRTTLRLEIL